LRNFRFCVLAIVKRYPSEVSSPILVTYTPLTWSHLLDGIVVY